MTAAHIQAPPHQTTWYLVLSRRTEHWRADPDVHEAHINWLEGQHRCGNVLLSGPSADGALGVYVLLAADLSDAEALAAQDPYIAHGLRTPSVVAWSVRRALRLEGPSVTDLEAMARTGVPDTAPAA